MTDQKHKWIKKTALGVALTVGASFNAVASTGTQFSEFAGIDMTGQQSYASESAQFNNSNSVATHLLNLVERHETEMQNPLKRDIVDNWMSQFEEHRGKPLLELLRVVDQAVSDKIEYQFDQDNYKTLEHFATPFESLSVGKGDCDDAASLKYFTLENLGVSPEQMRLVSWVGSNTNTGEAWGHLNLAVEDVNGTQYILDGQDGNSWVYDVESYIQGHSNAGTPLQEVTSMASLADTGKDMLKNMLGGSSIMEAPEKEGFKIENIPAPILGGLTLLGALVSVRNLSQSGRDIAKAIANQASVTAAKNEASPAKSSSKYVTSEADKKAVLAAATTDTTYNQKIDTEEKMDFKF